MKTSILKKSLLDYAIKGNLSGRFRKSNPNLNAFLEIESYNAQILKDKKSKEKALKELESKLKTQKDKELKQILKSQIQILKKEIAKLKTIVPLNADSAPFVIPPTWVWVRLGEICRYLQRGKTPIYSQIQQYPVIAQKCVQWNQLEMDKALFIEPDSIKSYSQDRILQDSDILLNSTGTGTLGRLIIYDTKINPYELAVADGHITIIRFDKNFCIPEYIYHFLSSGTIQNNIDNYTTGTTKQKELTLTSVTNFLIPLPPLAEQKEIVKTLDSLIALANTFDKTKEELKRIEKRIEKSLLQYAILGKLSSKFRKSNPNLNAFLEIESYNAQILKDKKSKEKALKELESKLKTEKNKEAKQTLKQTIQNLKKDIAKLTIITPLFCDSTMKDLESQGIEKSNFQYKNNICHSEAKPKNLTFSNQNEIFCSAQYDNDKQNFAPPFAIPPTWVWVRLGEVCENFTGDSINADKKDKEFMGHKEGLNYIGTKDISIDRQIIYENGVKIPYSQAVNFKIAKKYSTLLCLEGGSAGKKIGFLEENVCFGNKLCCFESFFYDAKFMYFYLQNPLFLQEFNSNIVGIIGGVSKDKIKDFLIPLPPLKEQEYITYTLDTLFTLTKGLKCE